MTDLDRAPAGSFIGMAGMAVVAFVYLFGLVLAPRWAGVLLVLVWAVLFVLGTRWFLSRPSAVFWLPVVAMAVWFLVVLGGDALFDWA